ncbi:hypothetical protein ACFQ51_39285 [Streptomyces kaempferi]
MAADRRLAAGHSFLESLPEVDPERIGLWGTSYAERPRDRPGRDGPPTAGRGLPGADHQRLRAERAASPRPSRGWRRDSPRTRKKASMTQARVS